MSNLTAAAVIRPSLLARITTAYGIEHMRAGHHVRRDHRGWIMRDHDNQVVGAITVRTLWGAELRPAFMDAACVAVLTTERGRLGLFAVETHPWVAEYPPLMMPIVPSTIVDTGPITLDAEWNDPVSAALQQLDGWSPNPPDRITLDGVGYALFADSREARLAIEFSNPDKPALVALERALLEVTRMLALIDDKGVIAPYVEAWLRHDMTR